MLIEVRSFSTPLKIGPKDNFVTEVVLFTPEFKKRLKQELAHLGADFDCFHEGKDGRLIEKLRVHIRQRLVMVVSSCSV